MLLCVICFRITYHISKRISETLKWFGVLKKNEDQETALPKFLLKTERDREIERDEKRNQLSQSFIR